MIPSFRGRCAIQSLVWLLSLCLLSTAASAQERARLHIDAALDLNIAAPLLAAFEQAHPEIELHYHDRSTLEVNQRAQDANPAPDVVISSAMPWQMARVNEGLAQPFNGEAAQHWPEWAKWRNEVFGFTFEPIVMVYRLELARHMVPPATHADLHALLQNHQPLLRGKVTTYSPSGSGIGLMLAQQDARYSLRFWDLIAAMGAVDVSLENSTKNMLEGLDSGQYWVGYNLLGSYALHYARSHPELIVQIPQDYALTMMRMAFIHRNAPNPQAANTFMQFLLSAQGQRVLAGDTPLFSVLPEVVGPYTAQRLLDQVGPQLYPIPINASLLAFDDPLRRRLFMQRWEREMGILER